MRMGRGRVAVLRWTFLCSVAGAIVLAQTGSTDLTRYVNTFIGTGQGAPDYNMGNAAGNTPPGAAYPFGMALWSPDTTMQSGGYRYEHRSINGFSLTHFSGRGISCWQDLPLMPVPGRVQGSPGTNWSTYSSTFSHAGKEPASDSEQASPGFYRVRLDNGVQVELTVTQRTGSARFAFPASDNGTLLVNAGGSANGNWGKTWIKINGDSQLYGATTSGNCGGDFSYTLSLASGYKSNRISWLPGPANSSWESDAWSACKMGVFSKSVTLKICRIW